MLFNSIAFLFSFLIFYSLYLVLDQKKQNYLLFGFGILFYGFWNWKMVFLLLASIWFNFEIGKKLAQLKGKAKEYTFWFGVIANLFLLCVFKYAVFFSVIGKDLYHFLTKDSLNFELHILLPVGISFYTFHNISYLVELKKEKIPIESSFLSFGIYDLFFPLLLAGPIERPNSLLPQINRKRIVEWSSVQKGISLFSWGIFQKAVIADSLAKYTQTLVQNPFSEPGILWILAFAFAFQVYADFSGYSNCAKGLAYMMGFQLMNNFHRPLFASNPAEFWKRWHISLSTWLRDYIYIPLGGNRDGFLKQNLNIMFVWILGGLWHGATYGYLVWGIYLGLCLVTYNVWTRFVLVYFTNSSSIVSTLLKFLGILFTFWTFALGLLLFQVDALEEFPLVLRNLLEISENWRNLLSRWIPVALISLPLLLFDLWQAFLKTEEVDWREKVYPRTYQFIFLLGFMILCLVAPFEKQEFFYFQF